MTREEAIKRIQDFIGWFKKDSDIYEALEMAIQALEKENIYDDKEHYVTISKALYDKLNIDYEKALSQEPCEMTAEEYRQRMIQAFHNADCDELIAICVLPTEKEFEYLEWLLKNHYKKEPCDDCRNCKKWDDCECGRKGHINGTSIGYSIGECKDYEPCDDAISRQYILDNCVVDKVTMPYVPISKIQEAPPVTPQQKSGEWKVTPMSKIAYCSICDELIKDIPASIVTQFEFCPNCGAKMVEPQESEDKE